MTTRTNWGKAEFWGRIAMWCAVVSGVAQLVAIVLLLVSL